MRLDCYAQRLLNPFRGAMHTAKLGAAEAVTTDGVHWDIYVSNELLFDEAERARYHTEPEEIRFGSWSAKDGLRRGTRKSSNDFHNLELLGAMAYGQLRHVHHRTPFAFRDDLELWLLDAAGQPLALLASALDERGLEAGTGIEWHAGYAAAERFASAAGQRLGAGNAGDYLTRYVNACAGRTPAAQWFRRHGDGSVTDGDVERGTQLATREAAAYTALEPESRRTSLASVRQAQGHAHGGEVEGGETRIPHARAPGLPARQIFRRC